MSTALKAIGTVLGAAGLLVAAYFGHAIATDEAYARAALAAERNPGHAMYQAEFKGAQALRAFQIIFTSLGAVLALNGATLVGLGAVTKRAARL